MSTHRQRYTIPCLNEIMKETGQGFIYEYCNTCKGEQKHVRHCEIHEKCTRVYVGPNVQSCVRCTDYKPQPEVVKKAQREATKKQIRKQNRLREAEAIRSQQRDNKVEGAKMNRRKRFLEALEAKKKMKEQQGDTPTPANRPARTVSRRNVTRANVQQKIEPRTWAYGITTVPERKDTELVQTIISLRNGGFDNPILFVDGEADSKSYIDKFGLDVTVRNKNINLVANWVLALYELIFRFPYANRYALFQDDILCCKGLKEYLDNCEFPHNSYINLITYPQNERLKLSYLQADEAGWYPSNQMGKGAQGLIFPHDIAYDILTERVIVERHKSDSPKRYRNLDGALINILKKKGVTEYVHFPSLLYHIGKTTTGPTPNPQPDITSFKGEDWDAMQLIHKDDNENKEAKLDDKQEIVGTTESVENPDNPIDNSEVIS